MKVTVLLRSEHELLRSLFDRFFRSESRNQGDGKKALFDEIEREILTHSQLEAEIFYPALAGTSSTVAQDLVSAAAGEHEAVEILLRELTAMSAQDGSFDLKVTHLMDEVNRHIEEEEGLIFDEARKNLSEHRLEELGLEMEYRRKLMTQHAA